MTAVRTVLGIDVPDDLLTAWTRWFAPDPQPFLLPAGSPLTDVGTPWTPDDGPFEVRDTLCVYALPDGVVGRSVTEAEFRALARRDRAVLVRSQHALGREVTPSVRSALGYGDAAFGRELREQADGHRFVWWPPLLDGRADAVLTAYVEEGRYRSRHLEVPDDVWRRCAAVLPNARELAGTFPVASGPNCFGTVMAAAGVPGAAQEWMQREPFEAWLAARTTRGGRDDAPGTVLVWRNPSGQVEHAAVTLGGGFALHKPSQGWMSPTKVLGLDEVSRSARARGRRLTRRTLTS